MHTSLPRVSKTELKKRTKAREVAAKKAAKAAAAPPKKESKKAVDMSDLNPNQYFELRSRQIKHLLDTKSPNPYPHKFHTELVPSTFVDKYQHLKRGETEQGTEIRLGARILSKRELGSVCRALGDWFTGRMLIVWLECRNCGFMLRSLRACRSRSSRRLIIVCAIASFAG